MFNTILWSIDPAVFPGLGLPRWYSLMWLLGVVSGYHVVKNSFRKEGLPADTPQQLAITIMVGAIIGARLGHVLFYDFAYYSQHPIEILPIKLEPSFHFTGFQGLASHGGVIGALLGLYWFNRKRKLSYRWLLDQLTIGGALLGGFIRLGNLFNSEIIGKPAEVPWAFIFSRVDNIPRHPAQLYEAIFYFLIAGFLFLVSEKRKHIPAPGFICGLGLCLIFIQRFLVEFLKENQVAFENELPINMGQILSIPVILLGLLIMWRTSRKRTPS